MDLFQFHVFFGGKSLATFIFQVPIHRLHPEFELVNGARFYCPAYENNHKHIQIISFAGQYYV